MEALSKLLLLRDPLDKNTAAQACLDWERRCVESFIYHNAVATLYDSELDLKLISRSISAKFPSCLQPSLAATVAEPDSLWHFTLKSPTLGAPSDVFFLLAEAKRLIRAPRPLLIEEEVKVSSYYYLLRQWEFRLDSLERRQASDGGLWMGKPYVTATRLLFLLILVPTEDEFHESFLVELRHILSEISRLLQRLEQYLHRTWGKFLLWPLAIFGATASDDDCINDVRRLFIKVSSQSNSSTVLPVRRVLEDFIWSRLKPAYGTSVSFRFQGLQILLNGQTMANAAECLRSRTHESPLPIPL